MAIRLSPRLNRDGRRNTSMRRRLGNSVLLLITVAICGAGFAQSGSGDDLANRVQIQIVNFTLEDFSTTKLVIGVGLAANSNRNITVDRLVLSGLHVNGVPIYASPLKHRFKLRRDATVTLPERLQVTVYLRDIDSIEPLRKAILEGEATLDGFAVVQVPLSPLARIMLLSNHAEVSTALHQRVPFTIPGGPIAASSLLRILNVADAALKALESTFAGATKLDLR